MKDETFSPAAVTFREARQFINRLTPRQRKKLRELRKNVWWWRQKEFRKADKDHPVNGIAFDFSDNGTKRVCRNYELARRAPNKKGEKALFARSYLDLGRDERTMCFVLWIPPSEAPIRYAMNPTQQSEPGWFAFDPKTQWNLSASDNTLKEFFIRQIQLARQIQKFQPKKPNKGKKNAPPSWDYIELLDREKYGIGLPFNENERHRAIEAARLAKRFREEYRQFLKEWSKRTDPFDLGGPYEGEDVEN